MNGTPNGITREQVERLLAAVYPTRIERVLAAFVTWAYTHREGSIPNRLGDRADDLKLWLQRRRARRRVRS